MDLVAQQQHVVIARPNTRSISVAETNTFSLSDTLYALHEQHTRVGAAVQIGAACSLFCSESAGSHFHIAKPKPRQGPPFS